MNDWGARWLNVGLVLALVDEGRGAVRCEPRMELKVSILLLALLRLASTLESKDDLFYDTIYDIDNRKIMLRGIFVDS